MALHFLPLAAPLPVAALSPLERESLLLRTKTMIEIRDAAIWLGVTFAQAYAERREVWQQRYRFLR